MAETSSPAESASVDLPAEALSFLSEWLGSGWTAAELRGDASVRRYYRVASGGRTYMVAYYPPELREQAARFLGAWSSISGSVRVPAVVRSCSFAVAQEDVGDFTLFDLLHQDRELGIAGYRDAVDMLQDLRNSPATAAGLNPPFDAAKFQEELLMTLEYYVARLAGARSNTKVLEELFMTLSIEIATHPYVLTHRDYHGQNIHIFNKSLYIIDYQDLRMGPDTYDLASLLRDRGVAAILGREAEERLIAHYAARLGAGPELRRRYLQTLLQRSIKILGTFAKQAIARGRRRYLAFIPETLASVRFCAAELPEYSVLLEIFPFDHPTN